MKSFLRSLLGLIARILLRRRHQARETAKSLERSEGRAKVDDRVRRMPDDELDDLLR